MRGATRRLSHGAPTLDPLSLQATLRPAAKATAAALTLGAGVPLGPEGPSVQIGSAVATALQRISPSSEQRRLSLLAAGSAAGLSAGFGTTLAGAFFAVEAVLQPSSAAGRPSDPPSLTASMVLLSAVLASVVSRAGLGASPTFIVPQYDLNSLAELPLFLGLGAAAGGIGIAFSAATSAAADAAATLEAPREDGGVGIPSALMPPLGGLLAGTVALLYPEILYNGFDNADAILANPGTIYSPALLLQLVGAKLVTTAACRASGLVGGFYAPALFMGAALGAAYGQLAQHLPFADVLVVGSPEAYALVGMAATLAAVCRVPLTAILLLFEYTQDFRIIVPLMASVGVAAWVASVSDERASTAAAAAEAAAAAASEEEALERAQAAGRASVRAVGDRELGTALGEDALLERILRELPVSRAMRKDFLRVPADASLLAAGAAMVGASERAAVLTGPDGRAVGVLTHNALQRALREAGGDSAAASAPGAAAAACARSGGSFNPRAPGAVHPDTPLAEALAALNGLGVQQLPVVARDAASAAAPPPVGLLEAEAVGTACALELTQRALRRASLSPPGSGKGKGGPGATPPGSAGGSSQHAGGSTPQSPQSPQAGKVVSAAAALEEGSPGPGASTAARRLFSELAACDAL
jgi:H+/Cl- antiporter ClcA/CBS domain-containing protein